MDRDIAEWRPSARGIGRPRVARHGPGDLVGLYYATWQVVDVTPVEDYDLSDDERRHMGLFKPDARESRRPYYVVLRHERGPLLVPTKRLHDGVHTLHLRLNEGGSLPALPDRYPVCSCHGDPWPCRDQVRDWAAEQEGVRLERLLASVAPGVCAGCLEPITHRQDKLSFPEEHALIPGAPGPTYHAGRAECWWSARRYETEHRLRLDPDAERLASCPGHAYYHALGGTLDCTAGDLCTGHHGPIRKGRRRKRIAALGYPEIFDDASCFTRVYELGRPEQVMPLVDCGFRHPDLEHVHCLGRRSS